jgi:hypothetical protein
MHKQVQIIKFFLVIYPKLNHNVYLTIHTSGHLSVHAQTGANNQIFSSN